MKSRHTWGETHPLPDPPRMSDALHAILRALVLALIICATSCSLQIAADGSKSFSIDATGAARALEILSEK